MGGLGNTGEKEDVLPEQSPPLNSLEKESESSNAISVEPVEPEDTTPQDPK